LKINGVLFIGMEKNGGMAGDLSELKTKSVKSYINELTNEYIEKLNNS